MSINYSGIFIELNNIENFASDAAGTIKTDGFIKGREIAAEVNKSLRKIKDEIAVVSKRQYHENIIPKAVEWLLDNWYIAEREGKEAAEDMKRIGILRAFSGKSIVGQLAGVLIKAGNGKVDDKRISLFLNGCQDVLVLSERELSVFITSLKIELILFLEYAAANIGEEYASELMENIFTSLRFLSGFDMGTVLENVNRIERELRLDPSGIYPKMDEGTRREYRNEVSKLAKQKGCSEYKAAVYINKLAENDGRHIGYYIFKKPFGHEKKQNSGAFYISSIVIMSLFFSILTGFLLENPFISFLLLFPISEIVKNIIDFVIIKTVRPKHMPRLELSKGVPAEGRTVCVISALLSSEESAYSYSKVLEEYYLANKSAGMNLKFGILADLPESKTAWKESDEKITDRMKAEIEGLNEKYGERFYFFCRERTYNESCSCYMGWERKRGAILELVRLLKGENSRLKIFTGNQKEIKGIKYIITLDSDTALNPDTASELIGAMLHPLNKAIIDERKNIVIDGCGIIQPRISVGLESSNKSDFTRIFAGRGGTDPYGGVVSDVYQDIFERGSFNGKGIIDIEAYSKCLEGRFPENTVLSHDLLEGAYLGCSYMGECELTDGYPYKVISYYERMHRWIRGDWQTIPWLRAKVKNASEEKVENPLNDVDKWKIADNIRRSLVPVFTFVSLITGMLTSGRNFAWAAFVAILSAISMLLISSADLAFRRDSELKLRYHSTIISGFAGCFLQTIIRLIFIPYEAWISASAIVTALYRMNISHKNMLSWVTAADAEQKSTNKWFYVYIKMWPCIAAGLLIWLVAPNPSACAVGIVWILAPLYASVLSAEIKYGVKLTSNERNYVLSAAADIWRYFDDFITASDNYLPPDNWQEQPAAGIAHRTSPTNIGLAMMSALAAYDMGITSRQNALGVIENMLASIRRLEKWNGHLYNWYDTKTLQPLQPKCVSTVDSGNFAASLIVVREAMYELNAPELAEEIGNILDKMSFRPLYDNRRKLFYIGWDDENNKPTEGWYDLMASEARQTSYVAIARGDVPRRHWRQLSRVLVSQDNYSGMASWTGTMFEYLMPNLILPCYKNSMIYESSKFCIYAQKKAVQDIPWGMSESAFYAFDQSLSYRYKAHGVQKLALKRGMKSDTVISPYSTFLAMCIEPVSSVKNLRRLESMGLTGRYGFYEAADFTENRTEGRSFRAVKTFMVHHLGMSIIAADNAVNGNIMQKRFLKNREMAAYRSLLQEKVIAGGIVLKRTVDIPEKPGRVETQGWSYVTDSPNMLEPMCCLLSNGSYTVMAAENGMTRSKWGDTAVTMFDEDQLALHNGLIFELEVGNEKIPLTPSPYFERNVEYAAEFSGIFARITSRKGSVISQISVSVPPDDTGEKRTVEISSNAGSTEGILKCTFEPVLEKMKDFDSHPAYSRLSLEMKVYDNKIVIKRRSRAGEPEKYMCFMCSQPSQFKAGGEREKAFAFTTDEIAYAPEPPLSAETKVSVGKGKTKISYAISTAYSERDAIEAAGRILAGEEKRNSYIDKIAAELKMDGAEIEKALKKISSIVFMTDKRKMLSEVIEKYCGGQRELWKFGISGDIPIMTAEIPAEEDIPKACALMREHIFLNRNGFEYDLVFITNDSGDYRTPVKSAVSDYLRRIGCEYMLGKRGGVHFADISSGEPGSIIAMSAACMSFNNNIKERENKFPKSRTALETEENEIEYAFNENGDFIFETNGGLPPYTWSNILANAKFGYIACDAGTGHMWYLNSRENKINRWINRNASEDKTENINFQHKGKEYSVFASKDGMKCKVTFGFGFAVWEKEIEGITVKTTAFVPTDEPVRIMIIEIEGALPEDKIIYYTDLLMGDSNSKSRYIITEENDGIISARNPSNTEFADTIFCLSASEKYEGFTCDKLSWSTGVMDGAVGGGLAACISAVYPAGNKMVLVSGCADTQKMRELAKSENAELLLERTKFYWQGITGKVKIKTPDCTLNNYMNGWALYQNIACRMLARASVYQCGGAYGFRDQLQDVCAVIDILPELTKRQIILAASHQFEEGDVQHWWHKSEDGQGTDKGVRTRCSDDLLWLVYALCEYTDRTGDYEICDILVPYISSKRLEPDEHERYEHPSESYMEESVFMHCIRAADTVLYRGVGEHGLCYIGTGDWNDGMNMVGIKGKGESVWLTWFASCVLSMFSGLCRQMGFKNEADKYAFSANDFRFAAENAWDGKWYLRGYYDNGDELGGSSSDECSIDSIAQSFAVFADADKKRRTVALNSAEKQLFDRKYNIIKLFTPPFDDGKASPGYIKGYCPGYRENGGQYTHAAIWFAIAMLENGEYKKGWEMFHSILPETHDNREYKKEPFIIPADVCSNPEKIGMGGWTWYTGSAGWYYRGIMENLLGIRLKNGELQVAPKLPPEWDGYEAEIEIKGYRYIINVKQEKGKEFDVEIKHQKKDN